MSGLLILLLTAGFLVTVLLVAVVMWGSMHPPNHGTAYALARGLPSDPADLGLDATEWWLDRPDGAKLPVWSIACDTEKNAAKGLTAVFVHGWAQSRYDMLNWLNPWQELCEHIVLYDLRGHGDAEESTSQLSQKEELDLIDLLDRVAHERIVLVGLSMGAVIALHAAADANENIRQRIAGIVAYGPFVHIHESLQGRLKVQQMPARPVSDLVLFARRMIGMRHRDILKSVTQIHCPIQIIHGGQDIIAPLHHAHQIVEAGNDITLHICDEAEHLNAPFLEPEMHDNVIREFITKIKSAAT